MLFSYISIEKQQDGKKLELKKTEGEAHERTGGEIPDMAMNTSRGMGINILKPYAPEMSMTIHYSPILSTRSFMISLSHFVRLTVLKMCTNNTHNIEFPFFNRCTKHPAWRQSCPKPGHVSLGFNPKQPQFNVVPGTGHKPKLAYRQPTWC